MMDLLAEHVRERIGEAEKLGIKLGEGVKKYVIDHVAETIKEGGLLIIRLPTGYGKSMLTPFLASAVVRYGADYGLARVIHVLPLRSILQSLYRTAIRLARNGILKPLERGDVGYQASVFMEEGVKSTLFLSRLVYTTFDSYVLNFSKITPLRSKYASYEAARAAIYTALTVFDEVHLFAEVDESKAYTSLVNVISSLLDARLPVVVVTATVPDRLIEKLASDTGATKCKVVTMDKAETRAPSSIGGCKHYVFYDDGWTTPEINTEVISGGEEELVGKVINLLQEGHSTILVVRNKVPLAVRTFVKLRERLKGLDGDVILVHGRLSMGDRDKAIGRILAHREDGKPLVVVATQVVEAGVEVNADVLVTDPAPLAQLVQRAGRVCRSPRRHNSCKGLVVVVKPRNNDYAAIAGGVYDIKLIEKTMKKLGDGSIEWKVPDSSDSRSYLNALNEIYRDYYARLKLDHDVADALKKLDSLVTVHRRDAERSWEKLCGFVRDSSLVPILVKPFDELKKDFESCVKTCNEQRHCQHCFQELEKHVVQVGVGFLNSSVQGTGRRVFEELLEIKDEEFAAVIAYLAGGRPAIRVVRIGKDKLVRVESGEISCKKLERLERLLVGLLRSSLREERRQAPEFEAEEPDDYVAFRGLIGFLTHPGSYEQGIGLRVDMP